MSITEQTEAPEGLTTGNDLDGLYEIIDGRVVEKTVCVHEIRLAFLLGRLLEDNGERTGTGRAFVEMIYRTRTIPLKNRWPLDRPLPKAASFDLTPDLAVEVVSPSDLAVDVQEKIDEYF